MSDSEGSTILLSPGLSADGIVNPNEDDVFAWLRPHSDTAREAFSASVNSALKYGDKYEHVRQFLCVTERDNVARSPFTEDDAEPGNEPLQWSGAFMLSLKVRPRDPAKGWYLGTNRRRQPQEVDILLAPPTETWANKRIASKHARLFFHEQSCRMMLEARHTVTITKNGAAIITQSRSHVIEDGELIEIGACSYIFEYTKLHSTPTFQQDLVQFMKAYNGAQWSLNKLLSPASVSQPISIGSYCCSPSAFAQGSYGRIRAGWTQDGCPVAIKVFKEPRETNIIGHKQLMDHIGYHVRQLKSHVRHSSLTLLISPT